MRFTQLFTKTLKEAPAEETAINAQLLARGGFVYKNSAGVYSYLPLGWRVIERISNIVRKEMNAIGGVEMLMPALVDRKYLEATDRFRLDVGFDVFPKTKGGQPALPKLRRSVGGPPLAPYALGWTHEEVLTAIVSKYISSYKDLPLAIYQIQSKFRNEARAKSGILRGREFLMKDLYSFHGTEQDLFQYYEKVKNAYLKIFARCGLDAFVTVAGGGDFTIANTHEFQVLADVGEDEIFYCKKCKIAENKEISKFEVGQNCHCGGQIQKGNTIEVGNIFPLGTKYSKAFNLQFTDKDGNKKLLVMGSYGIGITRLMGAMVEIHHDEKGILWPKEVAPFTAHFVYLPSANPAIKESAEKFYGDCKVKQIEVLYDDRDDATYGEKFADADLMGIATRVLVSEKTLKSGSAEIKKRSEKNSELCSLNSSAIFQKILE